MVWSTSRNVAHRDRRKGWSNTHADDKDRLTAIGQRPRALLPDVLEGRIEPGRVFDRVTSIDGVPDGYRAMNEREAIKVMIQF